MNHVSLKRNNFQCFCWYPKGKKVFKFFMTEPFLFSSLNVCNLSSFCLKKWNEKEEKSYGRKKISNQNTFFCFHIPNFWQCHLFLTFFSFALWFSWIYFPSLDFLLAPLNSSFSSYLRIFLEIFTPHNW